MKKYPKAGLRLQPNRLDPGLRATRLPALLVGLMALANIVRALFVGKPDLSPNLFRLSPFFFGDEYRLFNLLLGLALLIIAGGLRRGKTVFWGLALGLLLGVFLVHLDEPNRNLSALAVAGGLAAALLATRRFYSAGSNPGAVRNGWLVWVGGLIAAGLTGLLGFGAGASEHGVNSLMGGAGRAMMMYGLFFDPWLQTDFPGMPILENAIYIAATGAWGYLLWMLELPQAAAAATTEDRGRARRIVQAHGRTSQAHLTLLPDKRYFFTSGGSMIAFTVCGRVAVTLGDPIGPAADIDAAIGEFRSFCALSDWLPAFCLTAADYLDRYRRAGFEYLCMGHEGIIDLRRFSLKGNASKTIRKRYNRLFAAGYRVEVYDPPIFNELLAEMRSISDEWLGLAAAAEKRFFLAWFDEEYVRGERIAVVRAPDGKVCAFTNLVPEYQYNEISIDLMRRRRSVESGTMDFLFVSLFLWARSQGYDTFNLGLSPLFGVGERPGNRLLERAIHYMYQHGNFYDFKGLNGFKMKFRPNWSPQYMVYPGLLGLGWVGLAMARVNAGENESLWEYFRSRPKHVENPAPEELPLLLVDSQGD